MIPKRESIELKGERLFLHERKAKDVLDLLEFVKSKETLDATESVFINTQVVLMSLKDNLKEVELGKFKWYQLGEKKAQRKQVEKLTMMFTHEWLGQNLTVREITELSLIVARLEGVDPSKKKVDSESVEQSQLG